MNEVIIKNILNLNKSFCLGEDFFVGIYFCMWKMNMKGEIYNDCKSYWRRIIGNLDEICWCVVWRNNEVVLFVSWMCKWINW